MHKAAGSLIVLVLVGGPLRADEPVDYARDIQPILARRCYACHGRLKQQNQLRLDAPDLIHQGGESGPVIVPGQSAESLVIQRVTADETERMPPEGEPLAEAEIALLAAWIDQGAQAPDEPVPPDPREHWAFQVPVRPPVPQLDGAPGAHNAIDAFLGVQHRNLGLQPVPPAEKHVVLRRVYLDLVGLPPTRDQLHRFLADSSADAYEKVVDRLLASPGYGERWGRHWMDVWRYSDWAGYGMEVRDSQRHIWRWRDWIIESLNNDKGYDRMIVEMLAGDEVAPTDPQTLRATGFLARNWFMFNRNVWLDNTVEHTAKGLLALTLNCARCHDHMYDPFPQADYYRFRAFFEPHEIRTDRVPGQPDLAADGLARAYDANAAAPTFLFVRGNEAEPDKDHPLAPALPEILAPEPLAIEAVALPSVAYYPGLRPFVQEETLAQAQAAVEQAQAARAQAREAAAAALTKAQSPATLADKQLATAEANLRAVEARIAADRARFASPADPNAEALALAAGQAERQAALLAAEQNLLAAEEELAAAHQALKADDDKTKQAAAAAETKVAEARKALDAARAAVETPSPTYTGLDKLYPAASTGRRLALARWIASPQNPLTARVAVNQMWLRHFGDGLVPTVFDFGLNGKPPTHPALLDWLAVEFMERGWSTKAIHRLIVTSDAYRRQSSPSGPGDPNLPIDPDNRYVWRMNARRMEAEIVRDSVLQVAGQLDLALGGPELDQEAGETSRRRSVYFRHAHEKQMTLLKLFDAASVNECYRRDESIVPQQALALANSSLSLAQARLLAASLSRQVGTDAGAEAARAFVTAAFEQILCRPPTEAERGACETFLADQAQQLSDPTKLTPFSSGPVAAVKPAPEPHRRAGESLVHVLLNHNDFVTIR